MKTIKIFLILFLLTVPVYSAPQGNQNNVSEEFTASDSVQMDFSEQIYFGYGYSAAGDNINSIGINPVCLAPGQTATTYFTVSKPVVLSSFQTIFPLKERSYAGIQFLNRSVQLDQYRAVLGFYNQPQIKFGIAAGLDREKAAGGLTNEKFGFALSPSVYFRFIRNRAKNFNLTFGINANNLLNINNFIEQRQETSEKIDAGLRANLFLKGFYGNIGLRYHLDEIKISAGLDYYMRNSFQAGISYRNSLVGLGFSFRIKTRYMISCAVEIGPDGYFNWATGYRLTYTKRTSGSSSPPRPSPVSEETLNKQKELLDRGLALYREKKYEEARSLWKQCTAQAPGSEIADEANEYIKKVNNILRTLSE